MSSRTPKFSSVSVSRRIHTNRNHGVQMWSKAKDFILDELYIEFMPRWFKGTQRRNLKSPRTKAVPIWFLPSLKLGVGAGLCSLSILLNIGPYEALLGIIGLYIAADGVYQLLDLMSTYSEGVSREAATLLIDLISYPFYRIMSRVR